MARGATEGDVALACMSVLVDELVRHGMVAAAVSPGSRSTPIALALVRDGRVTPHVHLDERSSAYFALGLAKASRRPVAVACTSGTAVANLLPAVVEASQSGVPVILLTADRPPELRGTGANQTIDQTGIFGPYPRLFLDAPVPEAGPDAAAAWRRLGAAAAAAAVGPPAGPVHVNLPFREPLVPTGATVDVGSDEPGPTVAASSIDLDPEAVAGLAAVVGEVERGVVLAGSMDEPAWAIPELARRAGWPLLAEPASGLRTPGAALAAGQHLLTDGSFAAAHRPDVVVQFGPPPTTRAAQALALAADRSVVVGVAPERADPDRRATHVRGMPDAVARELLGRTEPRSTTPWLDAWQRADGLAAGAVERLYAASDEPFEGRVARDLAAWLPDGSTLLVGSSMPIRDLDASMLPRDGLRVLANRGASGIDGLVSTALGIAAAGSPTYALIGDLSLLHDVGALIWSGRRGHDAVLVVPNNRGGGVFDLLPPSTLPEREELFVTPHAVDLDVVAAAAGAWHRRVDRSSSLRPVLEEAGAQRGIRIVEIAIDRRLAVEMRRRTRDAVAEALRPFEA